MLSTFTSHTGRALRAAHSAAGSACEGSAIRDLSQIVGSGIPGDRRRQFVVIWLSEVSFLFAKVVDGVSKYGRGSRKGG